jgi:hypothetical protein
MPKLSRVRSLRWNARTPAAIGLICSEECASTRAGIAPSGYSKPGAGASAGRSPRAPLFAGHRWTRIDRQLLAAGFREAKEGEVAHTAGIPVLLLSHRELPA